MIQLLSWFPAKLIRAARSGITRGRAGQVSALFAVALLCACAIPMVQSPSPGDSSATVIGKLGNPYRRHRTADGDLLEYRSGAWGQYTYLARLDRNDRLVSYEQVLTDRAFGAIPIGQASREDVLHRIGTPTASSFLPLKQLEVWSYPYKQDGVWNSVMHVHFDRNGKVHSLESGPDHRFDRDGRFPFGMGGI